MEHGAFSVVCQKSLERQHQRLPQHPGGKDVIGVTPTLNLLLTTNYNGSALCMSQVAYLAFGNGVLQPGESTKEAMRDAAEQVKRGEIPTISLNPEGFWAIPGYKLDPVYLVELGIIGAALFGASLTAYLLQASTCGLPRKCHVSAAVQGVRGRRSPQQP